MDKFKFGSIVVTTVFAFAGSVSFAQNESPPEACQNLGSQAGDSDTEISDVCPAVEDSLSTQGTRDLSDAQELTNSFATPQGFTNLSTAPPADYRVPDSVWSARESVAIEPDISIKRYTWTEPGVVHRNLIFEEPLLERHGFHRGEVYQPLVSGARFFWRATFLPFDVIKHHHRRCDSGLGWGVPSVDICNDCQR